METEISQEQEQAEKKRAKGFVNWEIQDANGEVILKSTKGYALFDSKEYPISKADAILLRKAEESGGRVTIPMQVTVVVNGPQEKAEDFDLGKLDV